MSNEMDMDIEEVIAHLTTAVTDLHGRTTLGNALAGVLHVTIKTVLIATHNDPEKATRLLNEVFTRENIEKSALESFYIELIKGELH